MFFRKLKPNPLFSFPSLHALLALVKSCLQLQAMLLWLQPARQAPGKGTLGSTWGVGEDAPPALLSAIRSAGDPITAPAC